MEESSASYLFCVSQSLLSSDSRSTNLLAPEMHELYFALGAQAGIRWCAILSGIVFVSQNYMLSGSGTIT